MTKIAILPPDLRNRIAAGEVIERPASVVKELIENALDAGATEIRIQVLDGGKRRIVVADNGAGMDQDDALLALQRHATSKLSVFDDLYRLTTMGFRGEALPSIASVSRMQLTTGLQGASAGITVEVDGGAVTATRDAAGTGTTVAVRDLFFNTPARKKFLKSTPTERLHAIDTVTRAALARPEVSFMLTLDGEESLRLARASGLRERILQIYGMGLLESLIEITAERNSMKVEAFLSRPGSERRTKSLQFLFLNTRPVRDPAVSRAVYQAYEGMLPPEKHPVFFIALSLPPESVDINVHPTKREVRFSDKDGVYRFLNSVFRETISRERAAYVSGFTASDPSAPSSETYRRHAEAPAVINTASPAAVSENIGLPYRPSLPFLSLGETFVAVAGSGGLMLIDHHAAHERILFERLLGGMRTSSQQFLFPKQVRLGAKEHRAVLDHRDLLDDFGITVEDFGGSAVIVRSAPEELHNADLQGILTDIASGLSESGIPAEALRKDLAARIACHGSIRGRRLLSQEELSRLLQDLEAAEQPDHCPHGRPTRIFYSLQDLKKLFRRT